MRLEMRVGRAVLCFSVHRGAGGAAESPPCSQTPPRVQAPGSPHVPGALAAPYAAGVLPNHSGDRLSCSHYHDGSEQLMCQWPLLGGCVFSGLMN